MPLILDSVLASHQHSTAPVEQLGGRLWRSTTSQSSKMLNTK